MHAEIAHPGVFERQDYWGIFAIAGENTGTCACGCKWHDPPSATCKLRNVALVQENMPGRENAVCRALAGPLRTARWKTGGNVCAKTLPLWKHIVDLWPECTSEVHICGRQCTHRTL